jgi:hypothetical protein
MPMIAILNSRLLGFLSSENGQGLTEYALTVLGGDVTSALSGVGNSI